MVLLKKHWRKLLVSLGVRFAPSNSLGYSYTYWFTDDDNLFTTIADILVKLRDEQRLVFGIDDDSSVYWNSSLGVLDFTGGPFYFRNNVGIGTEPDPLNRLTVSYNGNDVIRGLYAGIVYGGTAQEVYGSFNQAYSVGTHIAARGIGGRFEAVDYKLDRTSGSNDSYGGWFSTKDRTGTYEAGASHYFLAGYFANSDAIGDWATNNPPVYTYSNYIADEPTGYGSNHRHYSIYSRSGDNYLGGILGIGTDPGTVPLEVVGTLGQFRISDREDDNTIKQARYTMNHYDIDEQPLGIMVAQSTATTNSISFGGGSSLVNAATGFAFYAAANNTTTTGSLKMLIDGVNNSIYAGLNSSKVGIAHTIGTTLTANLDVDGTTVLNGTYVAGVLDIHGSGFPLARYENHVNGNDSGAFEGFGGVNSNNYLIKTTTGVMGDGFGQGFVFGLKDQDSGGGDAHYVSRIYVRRDGADDAGRLQFWVGAGGNTLAMDLKADGDTLVRNNLIIDKRVVRSKSTYTGTDTTDEVYWNKCNSTTDFTLTVTDGSTDGEEMFIQNINTGVVTLSGNINSITALVTLNRGESYVYHWDSSDGEWQ